MSEASAPAVRIVPGAPPPAPISKSQKKKRKAAAIKKTASEQSNGAEHVVVPDAAASALIEQAPTENDVKEGSVAPELVAQSEAQVTREVSPVPGGGEKKPSPIVDMLNKRVKATTKKIVRVSCIRTRSTPRLTCCLLDQDTGLFDYTIREAQRGSEKGTQDSPCSRGDREGIGGSEESH